MEVVNMTEKVMATFYDDEHEEWSQKTVTIADILDSVCDDYTVIETEPKYGRWIYKGNRGWHCSECDEQAPFACLATGQYLSAYCPNCGAKMDGVKE